MKLTKVLYGRRIGRLRSAVQSGPGRTVTSERFARPKRTVGPGDSGEVYILPPTEKL